MTEYLKKLKNLRYIKNKNIYRIDFLGDVIRATYSSGKPYIFNAFCYHPKGYNKLNIYYTKNIIITIG